MKINAQILILSLFIVLSSCRIEAQRFAFKPKDSLYNSSYLPGLTVDKITPGYTTLADLKNTGFKLSRVKVNDLNMGDIDSINATLKGSSWGINVLSHGYTIKPGMIVLQGNDSTDVITKIRLLKGFSGNIRGFKTEPGKTTVKDVEKAFPNFEWSSTDASRYFYYTNKDSIAFYVAKDTTIKEWPFDEKFYSNKIISAVEIINWKGFYNQEYGANDINYQKPLYAPLNDAHLNCFVIVEKQFSTAASIIGKNEYNEVRLGMWQEYSSDHKLIFEAEYDNTGKLIKMILPIK
ncbi:hypothetical protein [Mucilaginibacter sp. 5C4]|uniref:hypothetical protein n=1 Tax=Mucilaginibacter sp. 5C4 TaxID=3048589 RepID=UPI002AC91DA3|nr:hypothetical protein [Mucilaginibacter sp. 5C4]MEB0277843.1 hypothetical protein [Mucilaginibacter sp. 10B2]MEB0300610.1 hypothetical protein [Mucilaginibacter sp. 5C4]WPX22736.1 hypothetical protein RHM67_15750 [Mucilaginibacter sp. 5C4]